MRILEEFWYGNIDSTDYLMIQNSFKLETQ